jgi:hypothetical protein
MVCRDTDEGCGKPIIELKKKRKEKKRKKPEDEVKSP